MDYLILVNLYHHVNFIFETVVLLFSTFDFIKLLQKIPHTGG